MKKVYKLKKDLYTKDNNYIPFDTLFYIKEEGDEENLYVSVFSDETKIIWASSELFEFHFEKEIEDDLFLKKIFFLLQK